MSAPTVQSLTNKLTYARRQKAYAWAKYYEQVNGAHHSDRATHTTYTRIVADDAIPEHIKTELKTMAAELKKKWECPICLCMIEDGELDITNCGHYYCKPCLAQLKEKAKTDGKPKWDCAVCRRKHAFKEDDE